MKHAERKRSNFISFLIVLGVWILVSRLGIFNPYVLPTPEKVLNSFFRMLQSGEIFVDITISLGRVLKGFSIAFILAFMLGTFRILLPKATRYYEYLLHFFRNVPQIGRAHV